MRLKEYVLAAGKAWLDGLERWRGPIDVFWILYFAVYLCVGRAGLVGILGLGGQVVLLTATVFLVFVLPFLPRKSSTP